MSVVDQFKLHPQQGLLPNVQVMLVYEFVVYTVFSREVVV